MKNANNIHTLVISMGIKSSEEIKLRCLQQEVREKEVCNIGRGRGPENRPFELNAGLNLMKKEF